MAAKEEISLKKLEREIDRFLDSKATKPGGELKKPGCNLRHGNACVLATCCENQPRATPVDFFYQGDLEIWIIAEPGGKLSNIRRNENVSLAVYDKVDHSRDQMSIQLWGKAEIITYQSQPDLVEAKLKQFGLERATRGILQKLVANDVLLEEVVDEMANRVKEKTTLLRIIPDKIAVLQTEAEALAVRKYWEKGKAYKKLATF